MRFLAFALTLTLLLAGCASDEPGGDTMAESSSTTTEETTTSSETTETSSTTTEESSTSSAPAVPQPDSLEITLTASVVEGTEGLNYTVSLSGVAYLDDGSVEEGDFAWTLTSEALGLDESGVADAVEIAVTIPGPGSYNITGTIAREGYDDANATIELVLEGPDAPVVVFTGSTSYMVSLPISCQLTGDGSPELSGLWTNYVALDAVYDGLVVDVLMETDTNTAVSFPDLPLSAPGGPAAAFVKVAGGFSTVGTESVEYGNVTTTTVYEGTERVYFQSCGLSGEVTGTVTIYGAA